ncbi:acetylornithine deacetylase [Vannielia litorea]|uniref:Acetylornithine deacetylase n=1 Tax=Vannielia litorea TaxID=1217970 RepID=A0A1N6GGK1_9RHOB|nr:acetylornithine deacetylase [Vannielia litorea]SIO06624.1 acetylornithine deacetylase [Vannielia litorea]
MKTVEILDKLVSFDTVSAKSNLGLLDWVEAFLRERGARLRRVPDPDQPKAGLIAELGPQGAGVMLSAHTDVVPVEGQAWSRDPFRLTREGARLYGRGTTDMKGFLAAMLSAADRASGMELSEPLKLSISWDEEIGCLGIAKMAGALAEATPLPRACIVGEPTEMQVATGHKGKQALKAVCRGEAGHSALAPRFVNALHLAAEMVAGLRAMQDDIAARGARDEGYAVPYTTLHSGQLTGGTALNIVPDRAELLFEFRHLAADAPESLLARIDEMAAEIAGRFPGGGIAVERLNAYPGLDTPADSAATRLVQRLAQSNGTMKVAYGTEAGTFHGLGVPTLVCGPGSMEGQGHKPDEYVELAQLDACDAMLDRLLAELR